jgi:hypothetical protein
VCGVPSSGNTQPLTLSSHQHFQHAPTCPPIRAAYQRGSQQGLGSGESLRYRHARSLAAIPFRCAPERYIAAMPTHPSSSLWPPSPFLHTRTRAVHASETGAGADQLQANGRWACVDWRPRPRGGPRGESAQLELCTFSHSHCVVVSSLRIFHCPRPVLFEMSPAQPSPAQRRLSCCVGVP